MSNRAITAPPLVPERTFRGSGCDDRCTVVRALVPGVFGRSELLLHDAAAHEEYGALQGHLEHGGPQPAVARTGGLAVDLERLLASVNGRELELTGTELRLLVLLARRLDGIVTHDELAYVVWGEGVLGLPRPAWTHALSAHVSRLRRRLHPWQALLTTSVGVGYRLANVAVGGPPPRYVPGNHRQPSYRWAISWERCRSCGTSVVPHGGRGDCQRCADRRRRLAAKERRP
jgi:hypothetical protein